jgi:hypothetical protein
MLRLPEPDLAKLSRRPLLPILVSTLWLCGAWVPFFALLTFRMAQAAVIFARLEEKGALPASTSYLIELDRLSSATFDLPIVAFLLLLVLADLGMARITERLKHGGVLYRAWFAGVILAAACACLACVKALLAPF